MALKFVLNSRYPFLHRFDTTLPLQVEELRRENEKLRSRLVEAQQAKLAALQQAEQLRAEKERLRSRITALKQDLRDSGLRQEQLLAKLEELQARLLELGE